MWLAVLVFTAGILLHRPLIGIVVAFLLAASALSNYLYRRKPRSNV
jgi:hypothetical protein